MGEGRNFKSSSTNTYQALWLPETELFIALIGILTSPMNRLLDPFHIEILLKKENKRHINIIDEQ